MRSSRVGALVFLLACSSSIQIAPTVSTSNSCTNDGDCARYQIANLSCSSGKCLAYANVHSLARLQSAPYTATTPFTLVVSTPDTATFEAASTLIFNNTQFQLAQPPVRSNQISPCQGASSDNTCIAVIPTAEITGDYETDQATAAEVSLVVNQGSVRTSLPVHTTFRPLTADPTNVTTMASVGLPTIPVFSSVTNVLSTSETPSGPAGSPLVAWQSWLPQGRYAREISVDPPFNEAFPPWADFINVTQDHVDQVRLGASPEQGAPAEDGTPIDTQANRTYKITTGNVPLTGWSAFIRNTTSGLVISSTTTFGTLVLGSQTIVLNTVTPSLPPIPTPTDLTGNELVIAPPPGVAFPTLVYAATGGNIASQVYPPVPTPAIVQGVVHAAEAADAGASQPETPVSAWIDFISKPGAGNLSPGSNNVDLRYRTSVHTASDGTYSVTLPRTSAASPGHPAGIYDVIITPDQGTGYAVTLTTLVVAEDDPATPGDRAVQSGIGLAVNLPAQIAGRVTLTDGRPLGGVTVEAHPSSNQFPKDILPAELATTLPAVMPIERSPSTVTDANGFYSMPADPGIYDVFAKPPASSGFAWGVTTAHEVLPTIDPTTPAVADVDIAVPAPLDATMRLYVSNSSLPLAGALVRAYAPGPNSTQIQIGEGMTDSDGVLTLFLPPYLPQ